MKANNRQQLLLVIAAAGLVVMACDSLVLTPLSRLWKERAARIVDLKKSIAHGSSIVEREQNLRSRWESMKEHALGSDLSVAENEMVKAFDRWSQESRVTINSRKSQSKRGGDDYLTLEYRVDAVGSMESLTHFFYEIERDSMALKVESLEITTRDSQARQMSIALLVSGLILSPSQDGGNSDRR